MFICVVVNYLVTFVNINHYTWFTMINNEDFIKRLQEIIDFFGESASSFAEKIGVQRSSISHILSGRNKPSLDFILKILSVYPEVELYWLLNGKGTFPASNVMPKDTSQKAATPLPIQTQLKLDTSDGKSIERIVIFYSDGTFKNFQN